MLATPMNQGGEDLSPADREAAASPPYRPYGALRLVMAAMVMAQHFGWLAPDAIAAIACYQSGDIAVLGFFVLSGLIVTEAAGVLYAGRPLAFASNRALRIIPPFLLALLLSVLGHAVVTAIAPTLPAGYMPDVPLADILRPWNLAANGLAIIPFFTGLHAHPVLYSFLPYAWAIKIELEFYLVLTLVIWAGKRLPFDRVLFGLGLAALAATWLKIPGTHFACYFALGGALYFALHGRSPALILTAALAIACITVFNHAPGTCPARPWTAQYLLIAGELAAMTGFFHARTAEWLRSMDRRLGDLSYPLYLNQYVVIILLFALEGSGAGTLTASIPLALLLAYGCEMALGPLTKGLRDRVRGVRLVDSRTTRRTRPRNARDADAQQPSPEL